MVDSRLHTGKFFVSVVVLLSFFLIVTQPGGSIAQEREEPELEPMPDPRSPYTEDKQNGIGFKLMLNNYGFGVGSEYRRALSYRTEMIFNFNISNLKDEAEQTLQTWWGQQIIPNKFNRVLVAPITMGVKHRLFAEELSDNFRVHFHGAIGAAPSFVYPYFPDPEGRGFRPGNVPPYDVFQGWSDGYFTTGVTGELAIGADFGDNFSQLQSVRFGYKFHYYPDEIQIMEPNSPIPGQDGFDAQSFFSSPQITIVLGTNW